MNEKQKEIVTYLTGSWSPIELLCSKFDVTRVELSRTFAEMLSNMDVRVDGDIVHVSSPED